jgi:hypothetical protein
MNNSNRFTELAVNHHLVMHQITKELLEIDRILEQSTTSKSIKSSIIWSKVYKLFIKLLAFTS